MGVDFLDTISDLQETRYVLAADGCVAGLRSEPFLSMWVRLGALIARVCWGLANLVQDRGPAT